VFRGQKCVALLTIGTGHRGFYFYGPLAVFTIPMFF